jgi:hypothetical protein
LPIIVEAVDHPGDTVAEEANAEVDEEAEGLAREAKVGEQLLLVDGDTARAWPPVPSPFKVIDLARRSSADPRPKEAISSTDRPP